MFQLCVVPYTVLTWRVPPRFNRVDDESKFHRYHIVNKGSTASDLKLLTVNGYAIITRLRIRKLSLRLS